MAVISYALSEARFEVLRAHVRRFSSIRSRSPSSVSAPRRFFGADRMSCPRWRADAYESASAGGNKYARR